MRTLVYGVFVAFAAAFILLSTGQITAGVFNLGAPAGPAASGALPSRACADGIRGLSRALDRGAAATAKARSETDALDALRAALSPEWDGEAAIAATCRESGSAGEDAWAALLRLRRAEEVAAARRAVTIAPLRHALDLLVGGE